MPVAPPCVCPNAGWCDRYRRHMLGHAHTICQGAPAFESLRDGYLARLAAEAEAQRCGQSTTRDRACVHLGPLTGRTRDCTSCKGRVREKLYACAVHGECSLKDCRRCKDYHATPPDEPGGMGLGWHPHDHWGLSFTAAAGMSLYDPGGRPFDLKDRLAGGTAYFLGGGPSLGRVDLAALKGRVTLAVNSVCEVFPRPTFWVGADSPHEPRDRYRGVPWQDPAVLKLLPRAFAGAVGKFPSTAFFLRNGLFRPWQFLSERTVNWGGDAPFGAGRSVMLAALKLLWYLGARRVVLLGCDFHMTPEQPYAHSAEKDARGCASNNDKFRILDARFRMLRPYLERAGLTVVNATEGSHLTAFDGVDLAQELARC